MDPGASLERIGIDPATVDTPDLATLDRLQAAHVRTVPFENLSIVGDPYGDAGGEGVDLSVPAAYRTVVDRGLGGYCFELNGLFGWLLSSLGYDVDRVAARVTSGLTVPANHHALVVTLDRRYVVDVGCGTPPMRVPTPLDGTPPTDGAGVEWRVVTSDRPDATHLAQVRVPGEAEWSDRYVFTDRPRDLDYFAAANDYLQSAPESPFTGDPVVNVATDDGWQKLSDETLTEVAGGEERERTVTGEEWYETVREEFGIEYEWR
ncbi:arylamine N-acetyltransferase [Halobacteriales archaeon QS_8_69_26]|nr:MAG: arylamine N-acetyltransferase [Halobacteriales archaeon QS_8_69_26]